MKALFVSTSYPSDATDWKGQFIRHLLFSLAKDDELSIELWSPPGDLPPKVQYCTSTMEASWLQGILDNGGIASILRTRPIKGVFTGIKLIRLIRRAFFRNSGVTLAHVNWLQNTLAFYKTDIPLVVSVLGSDFAMLKIPGMVKMLRTVFKNRKVILCPNATWMVSTLNDYFGDIAVVNYIPLGIDERWFDIKPLPGSNTPRKWLVVLRVTKNKIGQLFEWGEDIFTKDDELHLFGPMQEDVQIPSWVNYHGPTHPEELINNWFPEATGIISLSEHDEGRPQILLEAMASSLPIIASALPAHKDIITDRKTGLIVESKESFQSAISWLLSTENRAMITAEAKNWAKSEIGTWDDCAHRYIETYHSILGEL